MVMAMVKSYYFYGPSQAAAGVVCAIYSINFIYALYLIIRTKAWIWMVMLLAILLEAAGFGIRIKSAGDVTARTAYIIQFLFIILAPVFMAGIIYVVFGRIVFHVVPARARTTKLLWVPPRWITPIFVGFDVIALLLQGAGAAIVAGTQLTDNDAQHKLDLGKKMALIGIGVQIGAFGLFSIIAVRFHFTSKRFETDMSSRILKVEGEKMATFEGSSRRFNPNWRSILFAVNASCILIMIRTIYRVIEFSEGKGGTVGQYEWYFYVFDALPIVMVVVLYNIFFPGSYLPHMGLRAPKAESSRPLASSDREEAVEMHDR